MTSPAPTLFSNSSSLQSTPRTASYESSPEGTPHLVLLRAPHGANDALDETPPADPEVFRRELTDQLPWLRRRALKLCRHEADADDLVSETLLRALRFEDHFQAGSNLGAWLSRIMTNLFVSRCRRRTRERHALSVFGNDPNLWADATTRPTSMNSLLPPVERALRELPPKYQTVLRLVELEDHTYRDAAERLEVPLGTIMSRLHRARRMLADRLRDEELRPAA